VKFARLSEANIQPGSALGKAAASPLLPLAGEGWDEGLVLVILTSWESFGAP
jgi:hypothetical protein